MKRRHLNFSAADISRIKDTVAQVEKATTGEIVPFVTARSSSYRWVPLLWALAGWAMGSILVWWLAPFYPWPIGLVEILAIQCGSMTVAFCLSFIPQCKRLTIPRRTKDEKVFLASRAAFLQRGLIQTKERTGVLIFLSLFERRIVVIADQGLFKKTAPAYWQELADSVVVGIHEGQAVDKLCEVIRRIGESLSTHFPAGTSNTNEISDDPVIG